jgi:hypothetical protein
LAADYFVFLAALDPALEIRIVVERRVAVQVGLGVVSRVSAQVIATCERHMLLASE